MYKTLVVAVLLLPTFALTQSRQPATPFPSPLVVAKGKLINQTAAIPTTTIFTPTHGGLYRLSLYMTLSKIDPQSSTSRYFALAWTDDGGAETSPTLSLLADNRGAPQAYGGIAPVLTFQAAAGIPITYLVGQLGASDDSIYSLYYTLERLE